MFDVEAAIDGNCVQGFRNEQIDIVIVLLQGGQAGRIVADVKSGAQRIVILGEFAERGDFTFAALPDHLGLQLGRDGMHAPMGGGRKNIGQFGLAEYVDDKNHEDQREQAADDFENAAGPAPAAAFLVVKNWLAFKHSDNPS